MDLRLETEAKNLAYDIINKYYCERDVDFIISKLTPDVTCIGAGEDDRSGSLQRVTSFMRNSNQWVKETGKISDENYFLSQLSQDLLLCDVVFTLSVDQLFSRRRVTFIFRETDSGLMCLHMHALNSRNDGPEVSSFIKDQLQYQALEELSQKNHQLQVILKAVKGGLKISRDDDTYSYAYVSDDLAGLFGYTKDEYMEMTGGSAVGAVYKPDLPRVLQECVDAFKDGDTEYAIKYRIPCKDGSLKWIIDSGKKILNESGNIIINSIYLDVTEMEEANQKIAKQKELLDSIYDSIMCGIIRYRLIDSDFEYISLNKEALRLLGYTSEAECFKLGVHDFYKRIHIEDRVLVRTKISLLKKPGDRFAYEYRLCGADNNITWVFNLTELILDSDGKTVIQMMVVDIADRKKLELDLEEERQRFRIAIEASPAIIFEYDVKNDIFRSFGTLEENPEKHNTDLVIHNFLKDEVSTMIDPDFSHRFAKILTDGTKGDVELKVELYKGSTDYVWSKVTVTPLFDDDRKLIKTIGKIRNIRSEKEKEFELETAKSTDGLTGLYTKEVGIRLIKEHLESRAVDSNHAVLMLLDMDDFKIINDREGSVFGDAILQEVANIIRQEINPGDICARLGGDEFILLLKNCNKALAVNYGPKIAKNVSNLFLTSNKELKVSVSIGMCSTEVAEDYTGLYRCSESTLKYVKEKHRGTAACYLDTCDEVGEILTRLYTDSHHINEISRPSDKQKGDLVSFALELLGKSKSLDDAIYLLLSRIAKIYNLDRISIMEVDHDYYSYRFSYQWAKNEKDLETNKVFYVNKDLLNAVSEMYDEEGLCTYNLNDSISKLKSCLHAGVWNDGIYSGSFSFEIAEAGYDWTNDQRKLMKELTKIIFSFVMKARADAISKAKTDFLSRMSHEIRTPMNAIAGMTTIAKSVLEDKDKTLDCLNKIESANTYLLGLINDILDMSRIESGKIDINHESTDIVSFITRLESLMRPQVENKGLEFVVENESISCPVLMVDTLRLNQILVNIIGNAIKFTDKGGKIVFKIETVNETEEQVNIKFTVSDTGIGISSDAINRIFNAFEQAGKDTSSKYGGTGLGLSISNRLVQMMGGNIEVKSQPGVGSDFFFTIAFTKANESVVEINIEECEGRDQCYNFEDKRVLLAEDNDLNREIAETILKMNNFKVESAIDGKEALTMYLDSEVGYYDVILMDIRMPIMDGLEATKRIRISGKSDARTVPIIAMTANAFDEDTKKSIDSGMSGHISKPFETDKLLSLLHNCCVTKNNKGINPQN